MTASPPPSWVRAPATIARTYTCAVESPGAASVRFDVALDGWETYDPFYAKRDAQITGTTGPDRIDVYSATARVRGLQGSDLIRANLSRVPGQVGVRSHLRGGKGHDRARGMTGRDTCRAEVRRSCER